VPNYGRQALSRKHLFSRGDFQLHSGARSDYKVDCDALSNEDIDTVAYLLNFWIRRVHEWTFKTVIGIPSGGTRLEKAFEAYCTPEDPTAGILLVDDVGTTWKSMEEERLNILRRTNFTTSVHGAVIFARTKPPIWIASLLRMPGA
jgi:hypothetical protein